VSTSITVRRYLNKQDVRYTTTEFSGDMDNLFNSGNEKINPGQIAKAVMLKDMRGMLMAVLPGPNNLDIDAINRQLHRNFRKADSQDYQSVFSDCAPGVLPPLGEAYGFETVIDDGLLDQDLIYFASGNNNELVRISGYDFQLLHSNAWYGNTFSHITRESKKDNFSSNGSATAPSPSISNNIRQQLEKLDHVPKLPSLAQKIIQLNTNPYAHGEDLAKILEGDLTLADQIIRYAQTAAYVKDPSISTIRQAISRGLTYDLVMNLALGIATTRTFKNTAHGPLGSQAYWRQVTYSATLLHGLCQAMPRGKIIQTGKAILCGILHNIGYLVFGHLFPKEFSTLNNSVGDHTDMAILDMEQRMFGTNHAEIGHWVSDAWNMPPEVIVTTLQHHNADYKGPYKEYVHLIYLTDLMLKQHNIGDASDEEITDVLLQELGLTRQQINQVLEKTIQGRDDLENMARQLAA